MTTKSELATRNVARLMTLIKEYTRWANLSDAQATLAEEAGDMRRARTYRATAQEHHANADRMLANLVGWASV